MYVGFRKENALYHEGKHGRKVRIIRSELYQASRESRKELKHDVYMNSFATMHFL